MVKRLAGLLQGVIVEDILGQEDISITGIAADSRKVTPGCMFVAVPGTAVNGHEYIGKAIAAGAAAVVCERLPEDTKRGNATYIKVSSSAVALGYIASQWYGNPSRKLQLLGVTGTNGKTTVATLLYHMARFMGEKAGLISTVANYIGDVRIEADHTTPDAITVNRLLSEMVEAGCTFAAMEVSSHACAQHRIAGLHFSGGIFTNLTRDHLDYHKTVDEYLKAKKSFFDILPSSAWALTNVDDKTGLVMLQNCRAAKRTYSLRGIADFKGRIVESRIDGTLLDLNGHEIETLFTGRFNAYNLTAVYGASILVGWDREEVEVSLSRLTPVAGRFQPFRSNSGVTAIVDYAHTPDAIINVLDTIRALIGDSHSIIAVTGAGGDRDKGKRPIMAREAALRADRLILTSDNPRSERPEDIIADMDAGLDETLRMRTLAIVDRRQAIRTAVMLAKPGDVVVVLGKGHETYELIQGQKLHFDDCEEVQAALATIG